MYGALTDKQIEAIGHLVSGKTVWALGSGHDLQEARQLVGLGASTVYAVDKHRRHSTIEPRFARLSTHPKEAVIIDCWAYFGEFDQYVRESGIGCPDVVFVKWPAASGSSGIARLLAQTRLIVYVGLNDKITACGTRELWRHLRARTLMSVIEDRKNTMLVYGEACEPVIEPRCEEELGAGDRW
jgi:hypothetical protein